MDPITDKTIPAAGTIFSLTVRRGAADPFDRAGSGMPVPAPLCYRIRVVRVEGSEMDLERPSGSGFDVRVNHVTVERFNHDIRPHVVAAYGPPPDGER